eukprot:gene17073-23365_t
MEESTKSKARKSTLGVKGTPAASGATNVHTYSKPNSLGSRQPSPSSGTVRMGEVDSRPKQMVVGGRLAPKVNTKRPEHLSGSNLWRPMVDPKAAAAAAHKLRVNNALGVKGGAWGAGHAAGSKMMSKVAPGKGQVAAGPSKASSRLQAAAADAVRKMDFDYVSPEDKKDFFAKNDLDEEDVLGPTAEKLYSPSKGGRLAPGVICDDSTLAANMPLSNLMHAFSRQTGGDTWCTNAAVPASQIPLEMLEAAAAKRGRGGEGLGRTLSQRATSNVPHLLQSQISAEASAIGLGASALNYSQAKSAAACDTGGATNEARLAPKATLGADLACEALSPLKKGRRGTPGRTKGAAVGVYKISKGEELSSEQAKPDMAANEDAVLASDANLRQASALGACPRPPLVDPDVGTDDECGMAGQASASEGSRSSDKGATLGLCADESDDDLESDEGSEEKVRTLMKGAKELDAVCSPTKIGAPRMIPQGTCSAPMGGTARFAVLGPAASTASALVPAGVAAPPGVKPVQNPNPSKASRKAMIEAATNQLSTAVVSPSVGARGTRIPAASMLSAAVKPSPSAARTPSRIPRPATTPSAAPKVGAAWGKQGSSLEGGKAMPTTAKASTRAGVPTVLSGAQDDVQAGVAKEGKLVVEEVTSTAANILDGEHPRPQAVPPAVAVAEAGAGTVAETVANPSGPELDKAVKKGTMCSSDSCALDTAASVPSGGATRTSTDLRCISATPSASGQLTLPLTSNDQVEGRTTPTSTRGKAAPAGGRGASRLPTLPEGGYPEAMQHTVAAAGATSTVLANADCPSKGHQPGSAARTPTRASAAKAAADGATPTGRTETQSAAKAAANTSTPTANTQTRRTAKAAANEATPTGRTETQSAAKAAASTPTPTANTQTRRMAKAAGNGATPTAGTPLAGAAEVTKPNTRASPAPSAQPCFGGTPTHLSPAPSSALRRSRRNQSDTPEPPQSKIQASPLPLSPAPPLAAASAPSIPCPEDTGGQLTAISLSQIAASPLPPTAALTPSAKRPPKAGMTTKAGSKSKVPPLQSADAPQAEIGDGSDMLHCGDGSGPSNAHQAGSAAKTPTRASARTNNTAKAAANGATPTTRTETHSTAKAAANGATPTTHTKTHRTPKAAANGATPTVDGSGMLDTVLSSPLDEPDLSTATHQDASAPIEPIETGYTAMAINPIFDDPSIAALAHEEASVTEACSTGAMQALQVTDAHGALPLAVDCGSVDRHGSSTHQSGAPPLAVECSISEQGAVVATRCQDASVALPPTTAGRATETTFTAYLNKFDKEFGTRGASSRRRMTLGAPVDQPTTALPPGGAHEEIHTAAGSPKESKRRKTIHPASSSLLANKSIVEASLDCNAGIEAQQAEAGDAQVQPDELAAVAEPTVSKKALSKSKKKVKGSDASSPADDDIPPPSGDAVPAPTGNAPTTTTADETTATEPETGEAVPPAGDAIPAPAGDAPTTTTANETPAAEPEAGDAPPPPAPAEDAIPPSGDAILPSDEIVPPSGGDAAEADAGNAGDTAEAAANVQPVVEVDADLPDAVAQPEAGKKRGSKSKKKVEEEEANACVIEQAEEQPSACKRATGRGKKKQVPVAPVPEDSLLEESPSTQVHRSASAARGGVEAAGDDADVAAEAKTPTNAKTGRGKRCTRSAMKAVEQKGAAGGDEDVPVSENKRARRGPREEDGVAERAVLPSVVEDGTEASVPVKKRGGKTRKGKAEDESEALGDKVEDGDAERAMQPSAVEGRAEVVASGQKKGRDKRKGNTQADDEPVAPGDEVEGGTEVAASGQKKRPGRSRKGKAGADNELEAPPAEVEGDGDATASGKKKRRSGRNDKGKFTACAKDVVASLPTVPEDVEHLPDTHTQVPVQAPEAEHLDARDAAVPKSKQKRARGASAVAVGEEVGQVATKSKRATRGSSQKGAKEEAVSPDSSPCVSTRSAAATPSLKSRRCTRAIGFSPDETASKPEEVSKAKRRKK